LAAVAITVVCYPLHADFPLVGCLYLLVVVVESAFARFISSHRFCIRSASALLPM
jgi:hypothetical protein